MTSVHGVDYNQCLPLPKAWLKTKMNPNGQHPVAVWVRFGFQLGSLEKKCSGLRGKPCSVHGKITILIDFFKSNSVSGMGGGLFFVSCVSSKSRLFSLAFSILGSGRRAN